jgi:transposase
MAGQLLGPEDRQHFLTMMRRQMNSAVHRRMNVLLLLDDGWPPARIAAALFIDETTVGEHRRLYETGGPVGVETLVYLGRDAALEQAQLDLLSGWVEETTPQTSKEVCAHVEAAFGVSYTPNAMSKLLKRLDFVHKKPKTVPAKADEATQRAFVAEVLKPAMDAASAQTPLYFVDATHPSYTGRPAHGWIRRGETVELKSNHGRLRININGALSWPALSLVHRQEDLITSAAMIRLFDDLEARHPEAAAIGAVIDNARYNRSRELRDYFARPDCKIRPIYLPSYAPNLNLIERFWHFLKRKVLFNKAYGKFALFKAAFDRFFEEIDQCATELRSLITDRFHFIGRANSGILVA